jgi:hypothetical protein
MSTREQRTSRPDPTAGILQDRTVGDLDRLLAQSRGQRTRYEGIWSLNLAYYTGYQWVYWNRGRIDRPRLEPWRMTITDNRVLGVVQTRIAKMTKQQPTFQVVPVSSEDSDLQSAKTGEKILDYLWRCLSLHDRLYEVLRWAETCASGFWKITWDRTRGQKVDIVVDGSGQPVIHDQTGRPIRTQDFGELPNGLSSRTLATGEVCVEVINPFEIYPDPLAKELEDCEWIIQETVKSSEYVYQHFGVRMVPDTDVAAGPFESRLYPGFQTAGSSLYKGVKVREYWCKANSIWPQGRRAVWAKGQMLLESVNHYDCLPYVMFKGIPVPGRFWPTCLLEQLRGPQTELNKTKSQIAENGARIGNPALLVSRQANANYSGVPGERIDYDDSTPNAIPTYLQPPTLPQYVLEQQDRIEASIEAISGQHEVTNAQVPAGVTAASAINLLMEADDTRLGPAIYDLEERLGISGTRILKLVGQYWTDQRTIMIAGADDAWNQLEFKGAALKENTLVEVQAGSMIPQAKAAKQAAIMQLLTLLIQNAAVLPINPSQIKEALRDMEAGGLDKFFEDVTDDEAQANRENMAMVRGVPLDINSFDAHPTHVQVHTTLQKSASYKQLPPPAQEQIERHVMQHRMMIVSGGPGGSGFVPAPPGAPPAPIQVPPQLNGGPPEEGPSAPTAPGQSPLPGAPPPPQ